MAYLATTRYRWAANRDSGTTRRVLSNALGGDAGERGVAEIEEVAHTSDTISL